MTRTMIPSKTLETYEVGPFRVNLIREKSDPMFPQMQMWSVETWRDYHKEKHSSATFGFGKEYEARAYFASVKDELIVKTAKLALNL